MDADDVLAAAMHGTDADGYSEILTWALDVVRAQWRAAWRTLAAPEPDPDAISQALWTLLVGITSLAGLATGPTE